MGPYFENPKKLLLWLAAAGGIVWLLCNLSLTAKAMESILRLLSPFITGGLIAFVLNVPMVFLEKKLFANFEPFGLPSRKVKRPVALAVTLLAFGAVLAVVLFWVLPGIARSLSALTAQLPDMINSVEKQIQHILSRYPQAAQWLQDWDLEIDVHQMETMISYFFQQKNQTVLDSTISMVGNILSAATQFSLGLVFAFYLLLQKEKLARQGKKALRAFFPASMVEKILSFFCLCNKTFSNFLSGQCLESFLLGSLFFATMSLFRFPYALMTGLIMAITSLIPIFGAIIGCVGGLLLIWIGNPQQVPWFLLLFFILQQLEGNLIYPHVVGTSVGLPAIWVLVAVTIGGNLGGILGMFLSIPSASVLYTLLRKEINQREKKRLRERKNGLGSSHGEPSSITHKNNKNI